MPVSARLRRRIERDFRAEADVIEHRLVEVSETERVQAAVVMWAAGDEARLEDSLRLAQVDWRDVLVRAGLADDDWAKRLNAELGD